MGLKYFVNFTVAFSTSLCFYNRKKCHSLLGISEKVHITAKFQKNKYDKYAISGVGTFSIRSSRPGVFCKKGVFEVFAKFTGNTSARVSLSIKLQFYEHLFL